MLKHKLDFSKNNLICKDKISISRVGKSSIKGIKKNEFYLPKNTHYEIEIDFDEFFFTVEQSVN